MHAALEAGASGYVLKDSDADDVAAALRAAHRGELQLDPQVARRLMSSLREGPGDDPAAELTSRELEVLRLVATGKPNKEIAAELTISERTARTHVSRILLKLHTSALAPLVSPHRPDGMNEASEQGAPRSYRWREGLRARDACAAGG